MYIHLNQLRLYQDLFIFRSYFHTATNAAFPYLACYARDLKKKASEKNRFFFPSFYYFILLQIIPKIIGSLSPYYYFRRKLRRAYRALRFENERINKRSIDRSIDDVGNSVSCLPLKGERKISIYSRPFDRPWIHRHGSVFARVIFLSASPVSVPEAVGIEGGLYSIPEASPTEKEQYRSLRGTRSRPERRRFFFASLRSLLFLLRRSLPLSRMSLSSLDFIYQ